MKKFLTSLCLLWCFYLNAQSYQPVNTYGFKWKRGIFDGALFIPRGTGTGIDSDTTRSGAIRYNTTSNNIQVWDGTQWNNLVSGTGIYLDSAYCSNDTIYFRKSNGDYLPVVLPSVTASIGLTKTGNDIALGGTFNSDVAILGTNNNALYLRGTSATNFSTDPNVTELRVRSSNILLKAITQNTGLSSILTLSPNGGSINGTAPFTITSNNGASRSDLNISPDSVGVTSNSIRLQGRTRADTFSIGKLAQYKFDLYGNNSIMRWEEQRLALAWDTGFRRNTIVGYDAGKSTSVYQQASIFGYQAALNNIGSYGTFFGFQAGVNNNGSYNTAIGIGALAAVKGDNNTAIGSYAGLTSDSTENTFIGTRSGREAYSYKSVFVGSNSSISAYDATQSVPNSEYSTDATMSITGTNASTIITSAGLSNGDRRAARIIFNSPYPISTTGDTIKVVSSKVVVSSSSLLFVNGPAISSSNPGTGGSTVYLTSKTTNSQVFGNNATADASNQAVVGDTNVTQLKTGRARFNISLQGTAGQVLQSNGSQYTPVTLSFASDSAATLTVDNIAALRVNSFYLNPKKKTVFVKGYYSPGDDGGGWFYWDETNSNADDGGVTINPTANAGAGRWIRFVNNKTISVKHYGAKGDRATDDINAIRAAAAYVGSLNGGTVLFTNGEYTVSDSIRSESANMRFIGDKNATIIYGGSNRIGLILRHDSCEVSGLRFTTESTTTTPLVGAIFLQGASHCKIVNDIITGPSGHGIALYAGNSFHNNNTSRYQTGCNYNLIEGNTIVKMKSYSSDASDYSAIMVGYSTTVGDTGNIITNNVLHGDFNSGHGIALIGSVYGNIVSNNVIKAFRQYGVVIYKTANVADYSCQNNKIIANTIDSIGVLSGSTVKGMGIYLQKAEKTIVTNNHIRRTLIGASGGTLAQAAIGLGNSNDCDISDNRIDSIAAAYAGIRVNNSFNVSVTGNIINDGLNGVYCDKSSNIKIDGNIIINSRSQGIVLRPDTSAYTSSAGFASIPTGIGITITNNNITSSSTGIDYAATSVSIGTNNIISGNNITASGSGILVSFLKKSKISDNIITGSGAGNALQIGSSSDSNIVCNNYIYKTNGSGGTYTFGISDAGTNDNVYNNKIFNSSTRISFNGTTFFPDPKVMFGAAAPTAGTWAVGDRVYNSGVTSSSNIGWVCTSAGTPGTWTAFSTPSVTSVALSLPSMFTVSGSPVTSTGTLTGTLATQSANTVLAGPTSSTAAPTFRTLVAGDIPSLPFSQITGTVPVSQGGTGLTTLGTSSQQLRVNAGGTALEYFTPTTNNELAGTVYGDGTMSAFPTGVSYLILNPTGNNTIDLSTGATYLGAAGRVAMIFNATNYTYQIHGVTTSNKFVYVVWTATNTPSFINL